MWLHNLLPMLLYTGCFAPTGDYRGAACILVKPFMWKTLISLAALASFAFCTQAEPSARKQPPGEAFYVGRLAVFKPPFTSISSGWRTQPDLRTVARAKHPWITAAETAQQVFRMLRPYRRLSSSNLSCERPLSVSLRSTALPSARKQPPEKLSVCRAACVFQTTSRVRLLWPSLGGRCP